MLKSNQFSLSSQSVYTLENWNTESINASECSSTEKSRFEDSQWNFQQVIHQCCCIFAIGYQRHQHGRHSCASRLRRMYRSLRDSCASAICNSDEIRISLQNQDLCLSPSKNSIYVHKQLIKVDGTAVDNSNLAKNAVCHVFNEAPYVWPLLKLIKARMWVLRVSWRLYFLESWSICNAEKYRFDFW